MIRDMGGSIALLILLITALAILGPDYERTESSPRIFVDSQYQIENDASTRTKNAAFIAALGRGER